MLNSPLIRIFISTAVAQYIAPKIDNMVAAPEIDAGDATVNAVKFAGVHGAVAAMVWVGIGMLTGKTAAP
jgi:hypothetical protein